MLKRTICWGVTQCVVQSKYTYISEECTAFIIIIIRFKELVTEQQVSRHPQWQTSTGIHGFTYQDIMLWQPQIQHTSLYCLVGLEYE
jgi:hypothetical protein